MPQGKQLERPLCPFCFDHHVYCTDNLAEPWRCAECGPLTQVIFEQCTSAGTSAGWPIWDKAGDRLKHIVLSTLIILPPVGIIIFLIVVSMTSCQGDVPSIEREAFNLINTEREERGLHPVTWSEELHIGARKHSENMSEMGRLVHATGSFSECLFYAGTKVLGVEIPSYPSAAAMVDGWMDSSGHRGILLDPRARVGAVGVAKGYSTYRSQR